MQHARPRWRAIATVALAALAVGFLVPRLMKGNKAQGIEALSSVPLPGEVSPVASGGPPVAPLPPLAPPVAVSAVLTAPALAPAPAFARAPAPATAAHSAKPHAPVAPASASAQVAPHPVASATAAHGSDDDIK